MICGILERTEDISLISMHEIIGDIFLFSMHEHVHMCSFIDVYIFIYLYVWKFGNYSVLRLLLVSQPLQLLRNAPCVPRCILPFASDQVRP